MASAKNSKELTVIEAEVVPVPGNALSRLPAIPPNQLSGIEEFGLMRNWISFDAPRGKMVCRNLNSEYLEFTAMILESRVIRVMKDEDGNVHCASSNRITADTGRSGRQCAMCEDRDSSCAARWWIAWQDVDSGLMFAHTLSQTGSMNFNRYANQLLAEGLLPGQVLTRIFVEDAKRQKTNTTYRRIQFEKLSELV